MRLEYPIDENGQLVLQLAPSADPGHVKARLYSRYSPKSHLVKNILPLVSVETDAGTFTPSSPEFDIPAQAGKVSFTLKINGQPMAQFLTRQDKIDVRPIRKFSVFETRIIGRALQHAIPYPIDPERLDEMPTPVTDLHTHLSAQVSAHDLIELGRRHGVLYPTAALDKLHIKYRKTGIKQIPKRLFLPLAHLQSSRDGMEPAVPLASLSEDGLKSLEKALSLSPEGQSTFEAVETVYYLREPFTKNLALLPDILRAIANDYKHQGIAYAELSSNAVLDPAWLRKIHEVLPGIEGDTGVHLRFRAGLPRNLDDEAFNARVEQYKHIAASPYVVGPDILGYEINKTSHMHEHLQALARWIKENQPDDSLQIHAGENAKNPANVREALQLANDYDVRVHIGHALYGIDHETMNLAMKAAARNNLIVQFNFDSNLATNNIDFPSDTQAFRFLNARIPCVLGSDGASMYLTSARQTAVAGLYCVISQEGFKSIRATEEDYIARQRAVFEKKKKALPADFLDHLAPMPPVKKKPSAPAAHENRKSAAKELEKLIESKRPVFFAGAGGSSWSDVPSGSQQQVTRGLDLLLAKLNPDEVYFVKGRTKGSGVNIELEKAIGRYNDAHKKKFACVTMLAESEEAQGHTSPYAYTLKLSVPLVFMPTTVTGFLKEHGGCAFYVGGKNFTREFILASAEQDIPFGIMEDAKGASSEKARIYKDHAFRGAQGMVDYAAGLQTTRDPDSRDTVKKPYSGDRSSRRRS
jgi:hypothetical protein